MNKNESKYFNTAAIMDEALLQILETKDYEYISVKELCLKAGVNRSTFYLHYESMDDLLNETIEMINNKFYSSFQSHIKITSNILRKDKKELIFINETFLVPYLNFILENKKLFLLLCKKPYIFKSDKRFEELNNDLFIPIATQFGIKKNIQNYFIRYYRDGIMAIIIYWLENDCKEDINTIIDVIYKCTGIKNDLNK